jgi:hypothetical protein
MRGFLEAFAACAARAVLVVGLIVASVQFASAQQAQDTNWQNMVTDPDVAQQLDTASSLNLSGCWSGALHDSKFGSGTGFLFFVQQGGKAVTGTGAGIDTSGLKSGGPLTGTIKSNSFSVKFHHKKCNVGFSGKMPSSDLVGHYTYKCGGTSTKGSFTFTFDASGNSC